jgi:hypothetical protein
LWLRGRRIVFATITLLEDPSVRHIGNLGDERQFITTERGGGFPTCISSVDPRK